MKDGGYNVGYVAAGEYLRYSVDVTNSSAKHENNGSRFRAVVASLRVLLSSGSCLGPSLEHDVTVALP